MNAADLLTTDAVLTMVEVATVLKLHHRQGSKAGTPDRRLAIELVHAGKLRLVDADQPVHRWTVSTSEVRRYLGGEASLSRPLGIVDKLVAVHGQPLSLPTPATLPITTSSPLHPQPFNSTTGGAA